MKQRIHAENQQTSTRLFRGWKSVLRSAVEKTLETQGVTAKVTVDITLVEPEEIRRLNRDTRSIDRATDVLSFPLFERGEEILPMPGEKEAFLGDIVLCPTVIFRQAKEFDTTFARELCLMTIHSTLHLLGWDHIEEKEKKKMFALQENILSLLDSQGDETADGNDPEQKGNKNNL